MTELRRGFLAAVPPPEALDAIGDLVAAASRRGFHWTRREQWHVTVQYFGRVADSDDLVASLAGPLAQTAPARVQLKGAGGFPSDKRASVYWAGLADPEPLAAVHAVVMRAAGTFVRPRDRTAFVPHLTLARMGSAKRITAEVEALATVVLGPAWTVDVLTLFESETRREGARHHEIARLPLA